MRKLYYAALLAASALLAQEAPIGSRVADFQLVTLDGKAMPVHAANGVTAIIFTSVQCPVSNAYNERMDSLYKDYSAKGVHFIFVNSNRGEPADEVKRHLAEHKLTYTVYKDPGNALADRLNAQVTPEVYLLDGQGVLRYHGSIDDSRVLERVKDLRARKALDEMLAGKTVSSPESKAFGCTIKRVNRAS
jgi:hypothetical protein